jgi:hypothetical protein
MTCTTSDEPVPIKDVEYIDDVYDKISEAFRKKSAEGKDMTGHS